MKYISFILSNDNLPFINYFYSKNDGLDKNIFNVIKKSSGKFIWLCQDHTKIYEKYLKDNFDVEFVLDDRDQVVDMWRKELNLKCFQVNYGNF